MSEGLRIGSWQTVGEVNREELVSAGCIMTSTVLIHSSAKVCIPVHLSPNVQVKSGVKVDKFSFVNWNSVLFPNVFVGAYCSIGRDVQIGLAKHPLDWLSSHAFQYDQAWFPNVPEYAGMRRCVRDLAHPETSLGSDVWIGNGAMVTAGVKIGHGAVVGAGAIVTKDVEPYSIVVGTPAKHLKYRFEPDVIAALLELKWWLLSPRDLDGIDFSDVQGAISFLRARKA